MAASPSTPKRPAKQAPRKKRLQKPWAWQSASTPARRSYIPREVSTRLTRRQTLKAPSRGDLPMTANVLRILGMMATPVSHRIGVAALRISIAIVFLWIGALKFVPYEADSITPFVANSPVMSFFYKHPTDYKAHLTREGELNPADRAWQTANDSYAFSHGLGTVEVAIGLLTLVGLVSRPWGLLGATLAFLTPFVTLSFLVTTPEAWVPALGDAQHGFPYLSGAGRLVLKDVLLLAGAWLVMAASARALLATWVFAAPSPGRTESRLQGAALPINAEGRRNDAAA